MTVQENDCKKATELVSCLHMSSLLEAFPPLSIILQKAMGETGSFEGCMQLTLVRSKVLPRFSTFDDSQEGLEVKALSSFRVNKVHPAYDFTLTTCLPLSNFLLPNELLRKVMISDILCIRQDGVCNEPLCEGSLFEGLVIQQHLWVIMFIIMDIMFILQMHRQAIDGGFLLVHWKFHHVPATLCRTNVTGAYVIGQLIYVLSDNDGGTVVTFVYILVYIFDGLDGSEDLDVDMTVITCRQQGVIRNDVVIVKGFTFGIGIGSTIVRSGVFWITIIAIAGFRTE